MKYLQGNYLRVKGNGSEWGESEQEKAFNQMTWFFVSIIPFSLLPSVKIGISGEKSIKKGYLLIYVSSIYGKKKMMKKLRPWTSIKTSSNFFSCTGITHFKHSRISRTRI